MESVNISNCIDWVTTTIAQSGKSEAVSINTEYDLKGAVEWVITDKHWLLENLLCYIVECGKVCVGRIHQHQGVGGTR